VHLRYSLCAIIPFFQILYRQFKNTDPAEPAKQEILMYGLSWQGILLSSFGYPPSFPQGGLWHGAKGKKIADLAFTRSALFIAY
jgi:hypothetical protein